jgi:phospho-N-acetylmuramoyl-pentapeptide-transferase
LIVVLTKAGIGSVIRQQGPASHIEKKDTPALAGIGFMVLILIGIVALALMNRLSAPILSIFLTGFAFGMIGLTDDLMKQIMKQSRGFKARYRLPLQFIVAFIFAMWLRSNSQWHGIAIPGILHVWLPGYWLVAIDTLLLVGFVNAFNFSDGLDGLAGGLGMLCIVVLGLLAWRSNLHLYFGGYPWNISLLPVAALCGIIAGFLIFNWHPARIFMGDGGSYSLGGFIGAYAIVSGLQIGLVIAGALIFFELLSVVIQVVSFRTTGKRVFAMTPIHHAFELKGHKEISIVYAFWLIGALCAIACYFVFVYR